MDEDEHIAQALALRDIDPQRAAQHVVAATELRQERERRERRMADIERRLRNLEHGR